jgi:hypothetical protein
MPETTSPVFTTTCTLRLSPIIIKFTSLNHHSPVSEHCTAMRACHGGIVEDCQQVTPSCIHLSSRRGQGRRSKQLPLYPLKCQGPYKHLTQDMARFRQQLKLCGCRYSTVLRRGAQLRQPSGPPHADLKRAARCDRCSEQDAIDPRAEGGGHPAWIWPSALIYIRREFKDTVL